MEAKPTAQLVTLAVFLPWGSSQGADRMTSVAKVNFSAYFQIN